MKDDSQKPIEHLVADDLRTTIWLRLGRLTSTKLAQQVVRRRAPSLDEAVVERKAIGLSSAVRSALGYWQPTAAPLNARILSRYYATLQLSIAEEVAGPEPHADLDSVQRHTERGHGLAACAAPGEFPHSYFLGCLSSGHFVEYCAHLGIDLRPFSLRRRAAWADMDESERAKLVSLADLIRRIPELRLLVRDCLGTAPLSMSVGHATKNMEVESQRVEAYGKKIGQFVITAPYEEPTKTTFVAIYPENGDPSLEFAKTLGLPIHDLQMEVDLGDEEPLIIGEVVHPSESTWWRHIGTYKSDYCATSFIVPYWGSVNDPFALHLMILYAFSIVARYQPSLWQKIDGGDLDHVRVLLEHYLTIVDAVLPLLALQRITATQVVAVQPGSIFAPT